MNELIPVYGGSPWNMEASEAERQWTDERRGANGEWDDYPIEDWPPFVPLPRSRSLMTLSQHLQGAK